MAKASKTATPGTATAAKPGKPNKAAEQLSATLERDIMKEMQDVKDPLAIIAGASFTSTPDDNDIDKHYNDIEGEENKDVSHPITANTPSREVIDQMAEEEFAESRPQIRKVVVKKVQRFLFRLGLEKQPERYNLFPGVAHTWQCPKTGDQFITGFEDFPEDRKRLEKKLRVDLGPHSNFWATLTYRLEDKEHGVILNFDDPQMGAYNEVVYFGMLKDPMIANGLQEYAKGIKPAAEWYIENKEAEAEVEQLNMTYELEASDKFRDMSFSRRRALAKILSGKDGNNIPAWGSSDKVVGVALWQWIKKSTENAKSFIQAASKSDTEVNTRALAVDAIKLNVIRRNSANEYFFSDVLLGPSVDHVVQKLAMPQLSSVRSAITNQLSTKPGK